MFEDWGHNRSKLAAEGNSGNSQGSPSTEYIIKDANLKDSQFRKAQICLGNTYLKNLEVIKYSQQALHFNAVSVTLQL